MHSVAIVDSGLCNLDSITRAVQECGGRPVVVSDGRALARPTRIILPGVGAFPDAMRQLKERSLVEPLVELVRERDVPLLGICLGMQLLASKGHEVCETDGLGLIDGEVTRLEPRSSNDRVPHVGWNVVSRVRDCPLFNGIVDGCDFYFVHSYHLRPRDAAASVGCTPYAGGFTSAVQSGLVFGVQFHPEKSQKAGFRLLKNFLQL